MSLLKTIVELLPYGQPFLFVDELSSVDDDGCDGHYTFREDEFFYQGHFKGHPVTPGVILTECMAQIGLVCLGIYLTQGSKINSVNYNSEDTTKDESVQVVFSESKVLFENAVYPGDCVRVVSKRKYWRMGKLKCEVEMYNAIGERVCRGELSGILTKK